MRPNEVVSKSGKRNGLGSKPHLVTVIWLFPDFKKHSGTY